jgi:hypothetical protein
MLTEYVEKIMRNGISNFAKEASKSEQDVQILITWDDANQCPKYKKLVSGEPSQEVTFNQILNVSFDMLNRAAIVGQFITTTLDRYSKELNCMMSQAYILIALETRGQDDDELCLYLYRGKEKVKQLDLEQILG